MKNMWSGLVKAKLLKQWNKMKDRSTTGMDEAEKRTHAKAMKMVEKELGLQDDEDEEDQNVFFIYYVIFLFIMQFY